MLSDLPRDLAEDVLVRLPVTCTRAVRCVSKKWNTLSKDRSFTKKHLAAQVKAAREFTVVMVINFRVHLMSINLHEFQHDLDDTSINFQGKLVSLTDSEPVRVSEVYHCDGLLLCIMGDSIMVKGDPITRFVVWNPYCGQTQWLEPVITTSCDDSELRWSRYAIGYENTTSSLSRSYKVLRFTHVESSRYVRYEVYYINSGSSSSTDNITIPITILPDWTVEFYVRGVTLKGNTYWYAQHKYPQEEEEIEADLNIPDFLVCFDFTAERFGPRLSLPFESFLEDTVTLSSVRDEKLAVLFQRECSTMMEVWFTTKIEPKALSWNKFFVVDTRPVRFYQFPVTGASFFVDEEKKVIVVFHKETKTLRYKAYVIGEEAGCIKKLDFGEAPDPSLEQLFPSYDPLMCSYEPSLVQIKPTAGGAKRKKPEY